MEDNRQKFHDKLKELLVYAKKKKNVLEYQEINDFFVAVNWIPISLIWYTNIWNPIMSMYCGFRTWKDRNRMISIWMR